MKRFTTAVAIVLVFVMASVGMVGCGKKNDTIKIGFAATLTGGAAQMGNWIKQGALLAVEEANKAGGINGRQIELVTMDDRGDPKEAAAIANRFVSDKSIVAVVGHMASSCTLATAPIYNKGKLVQVSAVSSAPKVTEAGPYTFRVCNNDNYNVSVNVKTLLDMGFKRVGIIYENNDYGRGGLAVALQTLEDNGTPAVASESFMLDETKDFGTIIAKFRAANADAIFGAMDQSDLALFMKQCHQVGYKPQLASIGTYNPDVIRLGGAAVEGAVGNAMFNPDNIRPSLKEFFDKFAVRFKGEGSVDPNVMAPGGYDAARVIIEAMKSKGTGREDIKTWLTSMKDYSGALGTLSFDANGDTIVPIIMVQIKDGKFVEFTAKK